MLLSHQDRYSWVADLSILIYTYVYTVYTCEFNVWVGLDVPAQTVPQHFPEVLEAHNFITPPRIDVEPENRPLEKETHLPDLDFRFHVSFRG